MLDKLITDIQPIADLKSLYLETFLNHTSKVSKISDLSVLNAHAFAIAKIIQKDTKDVAIIESQIFPELSSGVYLDNAAKLTGVGSRLSASGSSTYVLVNADPGTVYIPGVSLFVSNQGVTFNMSEVVIIGNNGYDYIPIRSSSIGANTNVGALSIISIVNPPTGHINCVNEYTAIGGRDEENDQDFKSRISKFSQFAAIGTYERVLTNLQILFNDVLSIRRSGSTEDSKSLLTVISCTGKNYSEDELRNFENIISDYLSISDVNDQAGVLGIKFQNVQWQPVGGVNGMDFRVEINNNYSEIDVRKAIQFNLTKFLNFKLWNNPKVEWDDLLSIVKNTKGVKYVPDEYFNPNSDSVLERHKLPRVLKFIMRDMKGNILFNSNNSILPIYYNQ